MPQMDLKDEAWADFQKWVDYHDPDNMLTLDEQIAEYAADPKWKKKFLETPEDDPGTCSVAMGLFASDKSKVDLNYLLQHDMGLNQKVQVGQGVKLMYTMNMGLDGMVPTNHDGMKKILMFLKSHPDCLQMSQHDKAKLLDKLDQWEEQAANWHGVVAGVRNEFTKVLGLNEIAIQKAMNELNKNEVVIE